MEFLRGPPVAAALAVSILGMLTIGRYVLPFALLGLYAVLKWGGNRRSSVGILSGVGLPFLFVAYLNRSGPRALCQPYGNGEECTIEKGPWLYLILGVALVVTGVVVFLRLRRKAVHSSELGHHEAAIATEPIPHPLDLPIDAKVGKRIAVGAASWTIVGSIVASSGFSTVNRDTKPLFFAIILLATLVGIGAMATALRGKRRRNIQFLSLSIIAMITFVACLEFRVDPMSSTESKRVQEVFQQMASTISNKEGVPEPWLVPMHVGMASYPDGSTASLWVPLPSPQGVRLNCFYVDEPGVGGASGYSEALCTKPMLEWLCTSGMGGQCIQPGKVVNLARNGSIVVGSVGLWPAHSVFVTTNGRASRLPVRYGYFIIPGSLSAGWTTKFTITLLDATGASLGTVLNLQASGWGTPK